MPTIVPLLDFAVNGFLLQNRVVLHQFQTVGCVFAILLRDIAGSAGHAGGFVLRAFHNDHDAVPFLLLSHGCR